ESLLIGFVRPRLLIGPADVTAIHVPVAILTDILITAVLRIILVLGGVARLRRDAAKPLHPALASHPPRVLVLAAIDVSARLADRQNFTRYRVEQDLAPVAVVKNLRFAHLCARLKRQRQKRCHRQANQSLRHSLVFPRLSPAPCLRAG